MAASLSVLGGQLYALAAQSAPRMLIVFLRGAYDAANVVIPVSSSFYYESRPTLAVPKERTMALDDDWGLHPSLKEPLELFWNDKRIAFVPFCGTDNLSRSHFETQDRIEYGLAHDVGSGPSGFMQRIASVMSGSKPIAFSDRLPIAFSGSINVPNFTLSPRKLAVSGRTRDVIQSMYEHDDLAPVVAQGFSVQQDVYKAINTEMRGANRGAVSTKGFELLATRVGYLMRERFNLGFVDIGGWDTHVNQGGVEGYLPKQVGSLGRGLAALAKTMGPEWANTVVIVVSEFGRTFRENGNRGTDHGHGSIYWVLGGSVHGGRMAGPQVEVKRDTLFQDRDWPVLTNYRSLIGGILQKGYGFTPAQIQLVFPSAPPADLNLV
ncbi:DUF1501 domain-containing protein [Hansschlegelia zhihuaiae]|nr:DUF1501 domain-containing protein [Hansschlegelia zhihuaiae]